MNMTVVSNLGTSTPILPVPKWNVFGGGSEDPADTTPVALATTASALRDAVLQFSEALEPIHNNESIRVVSTAPFSGTVVVLRVGKTAVDALAAINALAAVNAQAGADPLTVFERVRAELDVTQKDLLAATGIKKRTYYSWKNPSGPRPRPSSLGRLWHLADALVDLRDALDRPIAAWLRSSAPRMTAFKQGRFDDLVELAVAMPKPAAKAHGTSRRIGVAADIEVPIVKTGKPNITVVKRGTTVDN